MFQRPPRPDLSNALIHLTGDRGNSSARDALISILHDGKIRGSDNSGYVRGKNTAACFTEMPLSSIKYFINHRKTTLHKYENFGIALSKFNAWSRGARPVIYLPKDEADWIPDEHVWRHVQFDHGVVDFCHEREWRSKGDFYLTNIGFYVLVPNREEENVVMAEVCPEAKRHMIGFLHMEYLDDFL